MDPVPWSKIYMDLVDSPSVCLFFPHWPADPQSLIHQPFLSWDWGLCTAILGLIISSIIPSFILFRSAAATRPSGVRAEMSDLGNSCTQVMENTSHDAGHVGCTVSCPTLTSPSVQPASGPRGGNMGGVSDQYNTPSNVKRSNCLTLMSVIRWSGCYEGDPHTHYARCWKENWKQKQKKSEIRNKK